MQQILGERLLPEFFWRTTNAIIYGAELTPDQVKEIDQLSYVNSISVGIEVNEEPFFPFSLLNSLTRLEELDLSDYGAIDDDSVLWPSVDEHDVDELVQLHRLRRIRLHNKGDISPELLARLTAGLPDCEIVDYSDDE